MYRSLAVLGALAVLSLLDTLDTVHAVGAAKAVMVCRESNWNFNWTYPADLQYSFVDLKYHAGSASSEKQYTIMSCRYNDATKDCKWRESSDHIRYLSRMIPDGPFSFLLLSVYTGSPATDSGRYSLTVSSPYPHTADDTEYDLLVLTEGNLNPVMISNDTVDTQAGESVAVYRYTWQRPLITPLTGVKMFINNADVAVKDKVCLFNDSDTTCTIEFPVDEFGRYSGTVQILAEPIYRDGTPKCSIAKFHYNIIISIDNTKALAKGAIAGLVVAIVVILITVCVTTVILQLRKKRSHCIPLKKGLQFVTYCASHIQDFVHAEDLGHLYRKSVPKTIIEAFIEDCKNSKLLDSPYDIEESMSRIQLAATIKHYLREEKSCWIPVDIQNRISRAELTYVSEEGVFRAADVRQMLQGSDKGDDRRCFDILTYLFRHFQWIVRMKEMHQIKECMDAEGISRVIAPNLFKEGPVGNAETLRQNAFIKNVLDNCDQIFTAEPAIDMDHDESHIPLQQQV